ncbi:MAG: hypothetical protein ACRENP_13545 [Longimicrobiales bacterium]
MFDDWKNAWQQAVENFQRELSEDEPAAGPGQLVAMRRDVAAARQALEQLGIELQRCRAECAEEEKQEQVCRRRGEMAAGIADQTTVQIAVQWAERHKQRALILRQKADVLAAELTMRNEDLQAMQKQVDELQSQIAAAPPPPRSLFTDQERARTDADFRKLQRERAAEEKLEELKKKMR